MIALLRLQVYGEDLAGKRRELRGAVPRRLAYRLNRIIPNPWVARLLSNGGREFLRGDKCFHHANSRATRGVYMEWLLEPGHIYDVWERTGLKGGRRFYCRADGGRVIEIGSKEAEAWLAASSVSTS